jgi:hypothetical protein
VGMCLGDGRWRKLLDMRTGLVFNDDDYVRYILVFWERMPTGLCVETGSLEVLHYLTIFHISTHSRTFFKNQI